VLITNQRFWWQARFGQIDMLLTAFVTGAILSLWLWHASRHQRWLVAFYCLIALGALTKGPPALVFPLLLAVTFYWRKKVDRKQLHLFWGSISVAATVSVWLIPARMAISVESGVSTGDGIAANLFRQTIGRFFLGISHAQWPWF
jgi:4-amino-4-deoxy-L-arabinose transferase-like glycosyltransferase